MRFARRSLQLQLAARLAALYMAVTAAGVGVLVYQTYETADALNDRELSRRAEEIARFAVAGPAGELRIALPPLLDEAYRAASAIRIFAVRDAGGRVVAASHPHVAGLVAQWPPAGPEPEHFRLEDFGPLGHDYYGLTQRLDSAVGPLGVTVARVSEAGELAHLLLEEFLFDVAWIVPLLVIATLAVGVLGLRRGLAPLRRVSAQAAAIGPHTTFVRLPADGLPTEIMPLVAAVNRALDRLEHGFAAQRRFTADAAHELRTPLAIVTAGLEALPDGESVQKLRADVARMNRVVDQLLRAARLDAAGPDVAAVADLRAIAEDVVGYMAPWAVARGRSVALAGTERAVRVRGDADAMADAIRNLIENAVAASPRHGEVVVTVGEDGSVAVSDCGPGVSPQDRPRLFERFHRGAGGDAGGAGLGLAIVAEIMRQHGGRIDVEDGPGGGALFRLRFQPAG